jgi:hypothetical protein
MTCFVRIFVYSCVEWSTVVLSLRASRWAILNRSSPTKDFQRISNMQDLWSPGKRFVEIHEPASSGRSGVRYAASIGYRPTHLLRKKVGVAGRSGCKALTPSLIKRPGPVRAVLIGPEIVFSFASINKIRMSWLASSIAVG